MMPRNQLPVTYKRFDILSLLLVCGGITTRASTPEYPQWGNYKIKFKSIDSLIFQRRTGSLRIINMVEIFIERERWKVLIYRCSSSMIILHCSPPMIDETTLTEWRFLFWGEIGLKRVKISEHSWVKVSLNRHYTKRAQNPCHSRLYDEGHFLF